MEKAALADCFIQIGTGRLLPRYCVEQAGPNAAATPAAARKLHISQPELLQQGRVEASTHLRPQQLWPGVDPGNLGPALLAHVQQLHPLPLAGKAHERRRPASAALTPAAKGKTLNPNS